MRQVHVFDIDGTVTTADSLLEDVSAYMGVEVNLEDLVSYEISESLLAKGVISSLNEFSNADFFMNHAQNYLSNAKAYDGVKDYVKWLLSVGHEVWFVTARYPTSSKHTYALLRLNGLPTDSVIHTSGAVNKMGYFKQLRMTHLYEDKSETIKKVLDEMPEVKVHCVRYPYNEDVCKLDKVSVIEDWRELLDVR